VVKPAKARSVVHQASTVESDASGAELIAGRAAAAITVKSMLNSHGCGAAGVDCQFRERVR